jgi:hypothetical protein
VDLARAHSEAVHAIVDEAVASVAALPSTDGVQAKVTAVDGTGKATVTWDGQTFGTKRLASYTAVVNDQVLLLLAGSSPVILGKIV